jgi:protein-tyrosine phosphatase
MRVLFLCLGNICRSPAAEGVARAMAEAAGLEADFDSAGTGDWHAGAPPYGPMQAAAARRGYDLSALRARQLRAADFAGFDLILAMDRANLRDARAVRPDGARAEVRLFLEVAGTGGTDVPDPYYTRDFDGALDLIEAASRGLIAYLAQTASANSPKDL